MTSTIQAGGGVNERLSVRIGGRSIPYLLGDEDLFRAEVGPLRPDRWLVVADEHPVVRSLASSIAATLSATAPAELILLPSGEGAKSMGTLETLCRDVILAGASRASVIVSVGGGNVANIAGLCAALLYRGIRLVQVPTTLMGMSDVVLSLKQGVNFAGIKNGLGTYYPAELVWANPAVLSRLPTTEVKAGQAEMVKNAFVLSPQHIDVLLQSCNPEGRYSQAELTRFVRMAIESKSLVLEDDPQERHRALVLEYGHTAGHALEALTGRRLSHGIAVALGMRVAARVAHRLDLLPEQRVHQLDEVLRVCGLPLRLPADLPVPSEAELSAQLLLDNKRGCLPAGDDEVPMVLIEDLARPVMTGDLPLTTVPLRLALDVVTRTVLRQPGDDRHG